jgi:hypothetical protein
MVIITEWASLGEMEAIVDMTVDGGKGVLLACFVLLKCTGLSDHESLKIDSECLAGIGLGWTWTWVSIGSISVPYIYPVYLPQILPLYLDKVTVGPRAGGVVVSVLESYELVQIALTRLVIHQEVMGNGNRRGLLIGFPALAPLFATLGP